MVALISQIRNDFDEETHKYFFQDTEWAEDENGQVDEGKLSEWHRSRFNKISLICKLYKQDIEYWSVLKYFVEPVDAKDCLKAFEQFELVVKYEASGHKVLSDQGYTFLQQLAWIVRHKICGH